jgi:Cu-Zn family superoxide dismutase
MKASVLTLLIPCAMLAACQRNTPPPANPAPTNTAPAPAPAASPAASAHATLTGKSGKSVKGELQLTASSDGVSVAGELEGLEPNTMHGFHVHETGDCSAADAKSAGEHFNPTHTQHGGPTAATRHLGDMPNIQSDAMGHAMVGATIAGATLRDGGANDLVGKAVIVHAKQDDYTTQPSGNSGDRVACGVVN